MGRNLPTHTFSLGQLAWALSRLFGVAVSAVYGPIAARLKRDLCLLAAASAGNGIHLARATIAVAAAATAGASPGRSASRATPGFVSESFGGEEALLFSSKGEGFSAIGTLKGFLGVSH